MDWYLALLGVPPTGTSTTIKDTTPVVSLSVGTAWLEADKEVCVDPSRLDPPLLHRQREREGEGKNYLSLFPLKPKMAERGVLFPSPLIQVGGLCDMESSIHLLHIALETV